MYKRKRNFAKAANYFCSCQQILIVGFFFFLEFRIKYIATSFLDLWNEKKRMDVNTKFEQNLLVQCE